MCSRCGALYLESLSTLFINLVIADPRYPSLSSDAEFHGRWVHCIHFHVDQQGVVKSSEPANSCVTNPNPSTLPSQVQGLCAYNYISLLEIDHYLQLVTQYPIEHVTPLLKAIEADEHDTDTDAEVDAASWLNDAPAQFSSDDTFLVAPISTWGEDRLLELLSSDVVPHDEHNTDVHDGQDLNFKLGGAEDGGWGEWDFSVQ